MCTAVDLLRVLDDEWVLVDTPAVVLAAGGKSVLTGALDEFDRAAGEFARLVGRAAHAVSARWNGA